MTKNAKPTLPLVRCGVYTRKSSEEGLQQEFNSLEAQREAAEAFVASQQHEGWVCLPDRFDDGGYTGGNTDRPALQRLMSDIRAGKVDAVLVYKEDRLIADLINRERWLSLDLDVKGIIYEELLSRSAAESTGGAGQ